LLCIDLSRRAVCYKKEKQPLYMPGQALGFQNFEGPKFQDSRFIKAV